MYRLKDSLDQRPQLEVIDKAIKLHRAKHSYHKTSVRHGSHGDYEKTITKAAWSSDSRIVVVGDLAGYMDSWILEAHEDFMQDAEDVGDRIRSQGSSDDGSNADEDDQNERKGAVVLGQRWTRVRASLPKLPSTPLILSFRPSKSSLSTKVNGNIAEYPPPHKPYPQSHDLSDGEDRMVAITSQHSVYEYQGLSGKLSNWSRRNPPSSFPTDFLHVRDRAMGCMWDTSGPRERIWLYGSTWLWMFDLSKDMVVPSLPHTSLGQIDGATTTALVSKKRKRDTGQGESWELTKNLSGAGNKIPADKLQLGISHGMTKITGPDSAWHEFGGDGSLEENSGEDGDDDEDRDQDGAPNLGLMRLRREVDDGGVGGENQSLGQSQDLAAEGLQPSCWRTYKYRPILGIVPLGRAAGSSHDDDDDDANASGEHDGDEYAVRLEVALVERPLWEADLAPRWEGSQEWNRNR